MVLPCFDVIFPPVVPQDFVIYVMTRRRHVFGRRPQPDKGGYVDTFLCAPDILPRHCCVWEAEPAPGPALVRPFRGAAVTLNGGALVREAELHPGDLLGLGQHFLFMYKDPRTPQPRPAWLPQPWVSPGLAGAFSCQACGRSLQERQDAFQAYVESREPELRYRPKEEEALLREIVRLQGATTFNLAPAFLLGLCLEHSTRVLEPSHFPRLVARMAQLIKEAVWEKGSRKSGDRHPENSGRHRRSSVQTPPTARGSILGQSRGPDISALTPKRVMSQCLPWSCYNLVQKKKVADMEKENSDLEGEQAPGLKGEMGLRPGENLRRAMAGAGGRGHHVHVPCSPCITMTKTLYSALPALLDSNPFTAAADLSHAQELSTMPEGIRGTLAIYQATLELTRECELHPDLVSQTFGYLFFFSNASLFNTLMERAHLRDAVILLLRRQAPGAFYRGQSRCDPHHLDLVLDGLQAGLGLGGHRAEFFRKLSTTATALLPRQPGQLRGLTVSLLPSLPVPAAQRLPALTAPPTHMLLSNYHLGWAPYRGWPNREGEGMANSEIFESFSDHPPLILPSEGFRLCPAAPVMDDALHHQLCRLRRFLWDLEQASLPANQRAAHGLEGGQ
nr:LOW QUALITY PROTEIN: ras-interacting protein 1 [Chelonoidis abingdonii]